ncbi:MAG TPA: succinic semialdehyde dehydrogenase [Bryobacteraceae bacterium]|nr:succinic semialdehyde dehydrogenase [Bryobacteraceae bacterium]
MSSAPLSALSAGVTLQPGPHAQIPVVAPFTGSVLGAIPACSAPDIEFAVARARAAQPGWSRRSFAERARIFLRFHDLLLRRQNEVLDLIQLENGKARRHAFEEILDTAVVTRYYALRAGRLLRPRRRKGALMLLTRTWELRYPLGVIGFLVPWNYPLNLAISDAVPALLAGNTAIIKPDPQTSFTALWAVQLLREAGLPPDACCVVTGEGPVAGPPLIQHADYVMFTGSTQTGKLVAQQAAERLIGCSLELGGKNPMIVRADADLNAAVEGAIAGCFAGAGQVCVSIERIYVHDSLYPRFLPKFAERAKALCLGSALDYSVDMGSLTSERQLQRVQEHVLDALEKGATLVAGGRRRPDLGPLFYEPTVLTGVRPGMKLYAEETFGPVVSVYSFAADTEAIEKANDTPYGLNASIWTRDTRAAARLARSIQTGSVNVNESYAAVWGSVDSPMGGWKQSGLHPRHGADGILKFTKAQTVAVQRLLPIGPPPGIDPGFHARYMTRLVQLLRRVRILG